MDQLLDDTVTDAEAAIAQAEAKLKKEYEQLELKKKKIIKALPAALPLPVKLVLASGYKSEGTVCFEMASREQVLSLLDVLPAAEVLWLKQKGGFSSFIPKLRFVGPLKPNQTATPVSGVHLNVEGHKNGRTSENFRWWTELDGMLVSIDVRLKFGQEGGARLNEAHDRVGRTVVQARWRFHNVPEGLTVCWSWATPTTPGDISIYWDDDLQMRSSILTSRTYTRVSARKGA